jgi:hypothetical protein
LPVVGSLDPLHKLAHHLYRSADKQFLIADKATNSLSLSHFQADDTRILFDISAHKHKLNQYKD